MKNLFIILFTFFLFSCSIEEVEHESIPDKITITNLHQSLGIDVSVENGRTAANNQNSISIIRMRDDNIADVMQTISPIPNQLEIDLNSWPHPSEYTNTLAFITNFRVPESSVTNTADGFTSIFIMADPSLAFIDHMESYSGDLTIEDEIKTYDITLEPVHSLIYINKLQEDWSALENTPDKVSVSIEGCFADKYSSGGSLSIDCGTIPQSYGISTRYYDVSIENNGILEEFNALPGSVTITLTYYKNDVELYSKSDDKRYYSNQRLNVNIIPWNLIP